METAGFRVQFWVDDYNYWYSTYIDFKYYQYEKCTEYYGAEPTKNAYYTNAVYSELWKGPDATEPYRQAKWIAAKFCPDTE